MSISRERLAVSGMTCVNCQDKIESRLKNTAGIQNVTVSYETGFVDITYDSGMITINDIRKMIEDLDYEVLPDIGKQKNNIGRILALSVVIISLYRVLWQFGILNLLAPGTLADTKMGYGMLFLVGLFTSVHCIAMCGGINLSQCIPHEERENSSRLDSFRPAFLYNLGRVISYTVIGFLLGLVGMMIGRGSGTGIPVLFQGIIKMTAGIFMVIMGINMLGIFPWLRRFNLRMPKFLAVKIGVKKANSMNPLIVGLLNGLMPCGPLQSMQLVAFASENPFAGMFAMFMFSLGTVPLMLGFGSLISALGKKFSQKVMSMGAVLVVVLGLAMLSQGGSLSGLLLPDRLFFMIIMLFAIGITASIPFHKRVYRTASMFAVIVIMVNSGIALNRLKETAGLKEAAAVSGESELSDGVQVIHSTLTPGRYPNITVQAGIPVKWFIDAPSGSVNGCNYKMILKEYGIEHEFTDGENVIEFTPAKTGTVQYTCWMGMIRGNIFVIDESGTETVSSDAQSADVPIPAGYQIPSEQLAVAQLAKDENGADVQEVSIDLTENGFSPAVIVVQSDTAVLWKINNTLSAEEEEIQLLAPVYSAILELESGENLLSLYPQESFEISTGDHQFYAYIKVVDDVNAIDETAIRQEVDSFETLIYPDTVFESSGMSCCAGD